MAQYQPGDNRARRPVRDPSIVDWSTALPPQSGEMVRRGEPSAALSGAVDPSLTSPDLPQWVDSTRARLGGPAGAPVPPSVAQQARTRADQDANERWQEWAKERAAAWQPSPALDALANQPGFAAPESPAARNIRLLTQASNAATQAYRQAAAAAPATVHVDAERVSKAVDTGQRQLEGGAIPLEVGPIGAVARAADALQTQAKASAIAQAVMRSIEGHPPEELMITVENRGRSSAAPEVEQQFNREVFLKMGDVTDVGFTRTHGGPILFRQAVALELADRSLPEDHPRKGEVRAWKERATAELGVAAAQEPVTRGASRSNGRDMGRGLELGPLTKEA